MSRSEEPSGLLYYMGGVATGVMVGIVLCASTSNEPRTPQYYSNLEDKVNVECVKPSQVHLPEWKDLDGDGKYEATINIGGKNYMFKFTGQGKPTLSLYTVTPAKTAPAKIVTEPTNEK